MHIYEGDTPVASPGMPGYSDAMTSSEADAFGAKVKQKHVDKALHSWVKENGAEQMDFDHPLDQGSYGDRHGYTGARTAANLPGGPGAGAGMNTDLGQPNLPEASNIATQPDMNGANPGTGNPHDLMALPPVAPMEPMTTKPRQMPDGPPSPGGPAGQPLPGMEPPGSDMGVSDPGGSADMTAQDEGASTDLDDNGPPAMSEPKEAHRFVAVLADVRRDNPGLPFREATVIAQRAMEYLLEET